MAGARGCHRSLLGQNWGFPRGSLGAQAPSVARRVPMPCLDPRRTPASPNKQPSASMGLGHMGPGCEQLAYVTANPQTPRSHPPHCEDPPVLPSVSGSPLTDGRTGGGGGEAPRSRLLSEPRLAGVRPRRGARQARGRHPHQKPPSVQRAPPCRYLASITGSLGSCLWNGKLSLPLRGPRHFPWTTPPSSSPIPAESQCQGRSRDLRPGRGAGHGSAPGGAVQAGVTHAHGRVLLWGVRPAPRLGG